VTSLPKFSVPGVPLDFVDVGDPGLTAKQARAALDALASVHMRHFDDYPHMLDEFERWRAHGWPDPDVDPHIWLAMREEQPVGEFVVHTNTRRGVSLFHFFAVDLQVRRSFPRGWLARVTEAFLDAGQQDCRRRGRHLLAGMCEVPDDHIHKWTRLGYQHLPLEYAEPAGGRYHRLPVEYIHQAAVVRTMPAAVGLPPGVVAGQALRAFLVDYYGLPREEAQVRRMLDEAESWQLAS